MLHGCVPRHYVSEAELDETDIFVTCSYGTLRDSTTSQTAIAAAHPAGSARTYATRGGLRHHVSDDEPWSHRHVRHMLV